MKVNTNTQIYTTGAFASPMKITDFEGNEVWVWVVDEFENDTFYDGEYINGLRCNSYDGVDGLVIDEEE